jgi:hypothetical protein
VMSIGMSTFNTPLLQSFLWLWLGVGARSAKVIADVSQARKPILLENRALASARISPLRQYGV